MSITHTQCGATGEAAQAKLRACAVGGVRRREEEHDREPVAVRCNCARGHMTRLDEKKKAIDKADCNYTQVAQPVSPY